MKKKKRKKRLVQSFFIIYVSFLFDFSSSCTFRFVSQNGPIGNVDLALSIAFYLLPGFIVDNRWHFSTLFLNKMTIANIISLAIKYQRCIKNISERSTTKLSPFHLADVKLIDVFFNYSFRKFVHIRHYIMHYAAFNLACMLLALYGVYLTDLKLN